MIQSRISRYQVLTLSHFDPCSDPRSDPRSDRPRRIVGLIDATFVTMPADELRDNIPTIIRPMKELLHYSIFLFTIGLVILPHTFGDKNIFIVAIICFSLEALYYFRFLFIRPLKYCLGIERASARSWTLNARSVSWLLDSLTKEEEIERFLIGIPGFYKSTQVEDPAEVLQQANTDSSPKALLAFMDRSLSSYLPEETRQRRIKVSLEAIQAHPYLLQRSFHHALRACSTESAIFKSIDFVLLVDKHSNDDDVKTGSLARCIITIAINRLEDSDYHADAWAGIIQRRLNWPEDLIHREHPDGIKLRNLIQLTRELDPLRPDTLRLDDTLRSDDGTFSTEVQDDLLQEACKLNVRNAAQKLRDDFCDHWNDLVNHLNQVVNDAQLPGRRQDPTILSHIKLIKLILSRIRAVHVSLHQGTESQSPPHLANTTNVDPPLQNPSSYSLCTDPHLPVASTNSGSNISRS